MEQFERQKLISQLFRALKNVNLIGRPEKVNKLFQEKFFWDVINSPLYCRDMN